MKLQDDVWAMPWIEIAASSGSIPTLFPSSQSFPTCVDECLFVTFSCNWEYACYNALRFRSLVDQVYLTTGPISVAILPFGVDGICCYDIDGISKNEFSMPNQFLFPFAVLTFSIISRSISRPFL